MTDRETLGGPIISPFLLILIQRVKVSRSRPGLREQKFSHKTRGSIGTTR